MRPKISVLQNTVRKVCQLTGQTDRECPNPPFNRICQKPAFNQTESRFGLFGTDLGSSFEHGGRLWFLFGDTVPVAPRPSDALDSVAWTTATQPEPGIPLEFINTGGKYTSPRLLATNGSVLDTGAFEVPVAGLSANGQMYILYTTDRIEEGSGDNGLDAFWIGPDGGVGSSWANPVVDNGGWRPAFPIAPPHAARSDSPIASIARYGNAVDAFWIGPDGGIGSTWSNPTVDSGNWHNPFPIAPSNAARAGSPLAVITRYSGALDVFWIGPDGAIATNWANPQVNNGAWHTSFPISPPGAARANSPIAAITRLNGALDVFWIGPDGAIATNWANPQVNNGAWHTSFPISPPGAARANSPIAAVTRLQGALDVFWIGPDGAVASNWANPQVNNGAWHTPFPITPPAATRANSSLAALTRLQGALDVFWIGPDGAVASNWANPQVNSGAWHTPFPISAPAATHPASHLSAVTRFQGALDVFWIGPDGAVASNWANPQVNNGAWHTAFPITAAHASNSNASVSVITRHNGYTSPNIVMGRSVFALARNGNPTDLQALYDFSVYNNGGKFINVAFAEITEGITGAPFAGPAMLAWGSGRYRQSNVYFACAPLGSVAQQGAWRFFTGVDARGNPQWTSDQRASAALFDQPQVGELSVMRLEPLNLWLLLYNAGSPRGINGRVASVPWGPWSDVTVIFDPGWPNVGYGHFMHSPGADQVSDPGREGEFGGEYGPYQIHRYTRAIPSVSGGKAQAQIYFVMSTWNPYNTVLMTATIQREADTP
jgi:hypothetical protein